MAVSSSPFLWYAERAEEAARFYAGLIPDSRVAGARVLDMVKIDLAALEAA